jgi:serine/threonine-protein phosphatase 2A regulatory subunit B
VQSRSIRSGHDLPLPKPRLIRNDLGIANSTVAVPRKIYQHAHAYHINSLSLNSDGESYLSADDLGVNLWNLERSDCSYRKPYVIRIVLLCANLSCVVDIIDIKPSHMEELSEVVTCAQFHPYHCHLLAYTTSKGIINLCDLRQASLIDRHASQPSRNRASSSATASTSSTTTTPRNRSSSLSNMQHPAVRCFRPEEDPFKSNFSEILSSISNHKFSRDGRYMVTRDYMTVKLWDINMEAKPVVTIPVHDHLKAILPSLYESDAIFDKFEVFISPNADKIITGSYNNNFCIFNTLGKLISTIQIPTRYSAETPSTVIIPPTASSVSTPSSPSAAMSSPMNGSSANGLVNGMKNLSMAASPLAGRAGKFTSEPVKIDQKVWVFH